MNKKKVMISILIIGIVLICAAIYLYYQQETIGSKTKQIASHTTTEEEAVTEAREATTTEVINSIKDERSTGEINHEASTTTEKKQNKKLPDNYEWDEKQWGEPPQIIYDFAENQEKFDFIVNKIDAIVSKEDGYVADLNGGTIYYDDGEEDIKDRKDGDYDEFIKNVVYILKKTNFYNVVREESGNWCMYYNQEENWEKYTYYMAYIPDMTEEKAWDEGYIKVVGDWYFATIWMI